MDYVLYPSGESGPVVIDDVDPDAVVVVGVDWSQWLSNRGLSAIDESSWHPGDGAAVGDGSTPVTKKGKTATPPAPSITAGEAVSTIAAGLTLASIYIDTGEVGDVITVSNHIRAGQVMDEVSMQFTVAQR